MRLQTRPFIRTAIVAAALILPVSAASALEYANPTKSYYAESVMSQRGRTVNVKTWYTPAKVKMQIAMQNRTMEMIGDKTAKTMTMVMPSRKAYFTQAMPPGLYGPLGKTGPGKDMKFEKVGEETIAGVKATKYKVSGKNAGGAGFDGHIWLTADNIMVRLEGKQTRGERVSEIKMDTKVLKVGPVDPKVYEIPKEYKKMGR